jgi:hypothetical protein
MMAVATGKAGELDRDRTGTTGGTKKTRLRKCFFVKALWSLALL